MTSLWKSIINRILYYSIIHVAIWWDFLVSTLEKYSRPDKSLLAFIFEKKIIHFSLFNLLFTLYLTHRAHYSFQNGAVKSKRWQIDKELHSDIHNRAFIIKRPLLVKSYPKFHHLCPIFGRFVYDNLQWYLIDMYIHTYSAILGS